jgi:O-antigen/teichoic acid export membrane protein
MSEAAQPRLRVRAARGTMVTAAFEIGLQALGLMKGFVIAAFLTASEFGIWGILVLALGTLSWLKQIGVSEKYVQQQEEDQELAFQKAFTIDLLSNLVLMLLMVLLLPLLVLVYGGRWELVAPALVLVAAVPAYSLRTPNWVWYRDMRFVRQRTLESIDPVVSLVVSVALAVAGVGYWSLVIGFVAGVWSAGIAAWVMAPYPLRLRWSGATTREYWSFSWPMFVASASVLVIPQASLIAGNSAVGLAGAGAIALAATISAYTDKVDSIVTWTLYPALCRVADRTELMFEAFVKSNRLTLMWGVPFGVGVALFADDLVTYGIGSKWDDAVTLIACFGLIAAVNHIGFNWSAFFRARGETKPLAVVGPLTTIVFLVFALPFLFLWGLDGFAAGMAVVALWSLAARTYYLRRLFHGFRFLPHAARAIAPTLPAAGVVLLARLVVSERSAGIAIAEVVLYVAVTIAATLVFERSLLREVVGLLRARAGRTPAPATPA